MNIIKGLAAGTVQIIVVTLMVFVLSFFIVGAFSLYEVGVVHFTVFTMMVLFLLNYTLGCGKD